MTPAPVSGPPRRRAPGVRAQLIGDFALMGVLLLVAALVVLRAGIELQSALRTVADQAMPKWNAAYQVGLQVGDIARSLRDVVLVEMQEDMPLELQRMQAAEARIDTLMADQLQGGARGQARGMLTGALRQSQGACQAALEQFAATMAQNQQAVVDTDALARRACEVAAESHSAVAQASVKMNAVSRFGARVAETTSVIDSLAFQTNILALNAAVEAARAGDRGQGFAVVAGEVRHLALDSAESAKSIGALIRASNDAMVECQHFRLEVDAPAWRGSG